MKIEVKGWVNGGVLDGVRITGDLTGEITPLTSFKRLSFCSRNDLCNTNPVNE